MFHSSGAHTIWMWRKVKEKEGAREREREREGEKKGVLFIITPENLLTAPQVSSIPKPQARIYLSISVFLMFSQSFSLWLPVLTHPIPSHPSSLHPTPFSQSPGGTGGTKGIKGISFNVSLQKTSFKSRRLIEG